MQTKLTCEPTELEGEIEKGVVPLMSPFLDLKNSVQAILICRQ